MKYWTIVFPGEFGQHIQETWSEDQIIKSYYSYWSQKMILAGKGDDISRENCIDDWCVVHWAEETDQFGLKYKKEWSDDAMKMWRKHRERTDDTTV